MDFLGLIIALYAAIISTYVALKEHSDLSISSLKDSFLSFAPCTFSIGKTPSFTLYSNNKYLFALHVRICNNSKSSTTINEFVLNDRFFSNSSSSVVKEVCSFFYMDFDKILSTKKSFPLENLKPLVYLEPYSTIEGYIVFNNIDFIPDEIKLTIKTVQKRKTTKLKVDLYDFTKNTSHKS